MAAVKTLRRSPSGPVVRRLSGVPIDQVEINGVLLDPRRILAFEGEGVSGGTDPNRYVVQIPAHGATGPTGPQGPTGPEGPQGARGEQGASGPQGETGQQGPQGEPGSAGEVGPQGPEGPTGPQGEVGAQGEQGARGPTGVQGPEGPAGPQGLQGEQGATGPAGPPGTTVSDGVATYSISLAETAEAIWSGTGGGAGNCYGALIATDSETNVGRLSCYCGQTGGSPGQIQLALYRISDGSRIALTPAADPVVGVNTLAIQGGPIVLPSATGFWLVLWSNRNGATFLRVNNRWNGAGLPSIAWEAPNTSPPANVLTPADFASNKREFRYWVQAAV